MSNQSTRLEALLQAARQCAPSQRAALLVEGCGDDLQLLAECRF